MLAGCGAESTDVAADVVVPCDPDEIRDSFADRVRPYIGPCGACHDGSREQSRGPPWFHPTDDDRVIDDLLEDLGMHDPPQLLAKPLAVADGGAEHEGGDWFTRQSEDYESISGWVEDAVACLPQLRGRRE